MRCLFESRRGRETPEPARPPKGERALRACAVGGGATEPAPCALGTMLAWGSQVCPCLVQGSHKPSQGGLARTSPSISDQSPPPSSPTPSEGWHRHLTTFPPGEGWHLVQPPFPQVRGAGGRLESWFCGERGGGRERVGSKGNTVGGIRPHLAGERRRRRKGAAWELGQETPRGAQLSESGNGRVSLGRRPPPLTPSRQHQPSPAAQASGRPGQGHSEPWHPAGASPASS